MMARHIHDLVPALGMAAAESQRAALDVSITLAEPTILPQAALLRLSSLANHAAREATPLAGEIRVRIVRDLEMAAAHLKYSKIEGTTDVLTFDLAEGASAQGQPLDVDILVCADEAARQATPRGISIERELLLYILHGVLHCLGHDDHDDAAYALMHAEEDRILSAIGVGATFDLTMQKPSSLQGGVP